MVRPFSSALINVGNFIKIKNQIKSDFSYIYNYIRLIIRIIFRATQILMGFKVSLRRAPFRDDQKSKICLIKDPFEINFQLIFLS
jgi:hypothetical protein